MKDEDQTVEQIKVDGINEFVCSMIGALESGFVENNRPYLAEIHRVAQNYCKDRFDIDLPHIVDQWGEDTAKLCGFGKSQCSHRDTQAHWDYVSCNSCGSVLCELLGSKRGAVKRGWFSNLAEYEEYKKSGVRDE